MNSRMHIELKKIRLFGYHGLVTGEEIIGSEYEVNLKVSFEPQHAIVNQLEDTLDYTLLLAIVKERMQLPSHLLETLATEISAEILEKFSIATAVEISIYKLQAPIINFQGLVGVTYTINRH